MRLWPSSIYALTHELVGHAAYALTRLRDHRKAHRD